ncbi:MAG: BrnT family toxin [Deltaproteobacteria bacterium]|nr:BrnT family toxin [Deltaproteobacteria bacterium]
MNFEWDEKKRQANIANHKLDFMDAEVIFSAPVLATIDRRKDYPENRWAALG